jgi:hypothetical protein
MLDKIAPTSFVSGGRADAAGGYDELTREFLELPPLGRDARQVSRLLQPTLAEKYLVGVVMSGK